MRSDQTINHALELVIVRSLENNTWEEVVMHNFPVNSKLAELLAKYPYQEVSFGTAKKTCNLSQKEHEALIRALDQFQLKHIYDILWYEQHSWGSVTLFTRLFNELMIKLSRLTDEAGSMFDEAWNIARKLVFVSADIPDEITLHYSKSSFCMCRDCRERMSIFEFIQGSMSIAKQRMGLCS